MSIRPPGTQVTVSAQRATSGVPTDTGVAFITGLMEWGPVGVPIGPILSMDDAPALIGNRVSYGLVYDSLDAAFAEGLAKAYGSRVAGPAALAAHVNAMDRGGSPQATLKVAGKYVGDKGNQLTYAITNGVAANTFVVTVKLAGQVVDASPELANPAAAAAWVSAWVTVTNLNSTNAAPTNNPAVIGDTALTGGTDDRGSITDTHWTAALAVFPVTLGPGQVAACGRTTDVAHQALDAHAKANNRFALIDCEDSGVVADAISSEAAIDALSDGHSAPLVPWVTVPGVPGVSTPRIVPPSAFMLGKCAAVDAIDPTAGTSPMGRNGQARYALDVTQTFSDADRGTLNNSNVAVLRNPYGTVECYGLRIPDSQFSAFTQVPIARARMAIVAQCEAIGEDYVGGKINKQTISSFEGRLRGMLTQVWAAGTLYGDTAAESFIVDVGPSVNTEITKAAGHLKAKIRARFTESAEFVDIEIVKVLNTEAV